jgi:hypothetical protein
MLKVRKYQKFIGEGKYFQIGGSKFKLILVGEVFFRGRAIFRSNNFIDLII